MTARTRPGDWARQVATWLEPVGIVADPAQTEAGRVWTTASDILPGQRVVDGARVTAGWGEVTFHAVAHWDEHELDLLWLDVVDAPTGPPRLPHLETAEAPFDDVLTGIGLLIDHVRAQRDLLRRALRALEDQPAPVREAVDAIAEVGLLRRAARLAARSNDADG